MDNKTKAAFKWIASTAIAIGIIAHQPVIAGERYHYKKYYYSSAHQHDSYCRHGNRQYLNSNDFYHRPKRHYYKQHYHGYNRNAGYGPRIRHYYKPGHRHGHHSGYRYKRRGDRYIKIRF